jgi:hypothetical protein
MTYRGKIQSCATILCTAEVESIEGRKVGTTAVMSDAVHMQGVLYQLHGIASVDDLATYLVLQVWMRAIVSDGPDGRVYATARALFVAPKPQRLIHDGIRLVFPAWPFCK